MHTMTTEPTARRPWTRAVALGVLLLPLAGCASANAAGGSGAADRSTEATLTAQQRSACEAVFSRTVSATAEPGITVVYDDTSSTAPRGLSAALAEAIEDGSKRDAALTLISVDGSGAAPRIIAKQVALSTEGDRDRPSVAQLASVMPTCVAGVLLPKTAPTTPGTDLHAALALASELSTPTSEVFVETDFVSTAGQFTLDASLLALPADVAAKRIAAAAPVDLQQAPLRVDGVGNTSTALSTANRAWLRALAEDLCEAWNATGCADIEVSPVSADRHSGPDDPMPPFPAPVATEAGGSCTFEMPASITFDGDSADLGADAETVFAEAIALAKGHPDAMVEVVGHTASSPDYSAAQLVDLATRRAEAAAGLFQAAGVPAQRLRIRGVGDADPKVEDIDQATGLQIEDAAAVERRVDVRIEGAPCPA